jgi:hypothetical protein
MRTVCDLPPVLSASPGVPVPRAWPRRAFTRPAGYVVPAGAGAGFPGVERCCRRGSVCESVCEPVCEFVCDGRRTGPRRAAPRPLLRRRVECRDAAAAFHAPGSVRRRGSVERPAPYKEPDMGRPSTPETAPCPPHPYSQDPPSQLPLTPPLQASFSSTGKDRRSFWVSTGWLTISSTGTAKRMPGKRSKSAGSAMPASSLESAAPGQMCGP